MFYVPTRCPRPTPRLRVVAGTGPLPSLVQLHLVGGVPDPDASLGGRRRPGRPAGSPGGKRLRVGPRREPVADAEPLGAVGRADAEVRGPAPGARRGDGDVVFVYPQ